MLVPSDEAANYGTVTVTVKHLKARHSQPKDLILDFDRSTQRFTEAEDPRTWKPDGEATHRKGSRGKLQSTLAAAWESVAPAAGDDDQGDDF